MARESEVKVLGIDPGQVRDQLEAIEDLEFVGNLDFKRCIFTVEGNPDAWFRLRTDGTTTTLAYKEATADEIDGMEEVEIEVSDFDSALKLMELMGRTPAKYQENRRELYAGDGVEVSIDYWPGIDPYVEIEGQTPSDVERYIGILAMGSYEMTSLPTSEVYARAGINLDEIPDLRFEEAA